MNIEKEFEIRYPMRVLKKEDKKIEDALAKSTQKNLQSLRKTSNRPFTMAYYEEVLVGPIRIQELKEAKEKGKKIIGTFCNFVPEELLYAAGLIPIRLCGGAYETIYPAEEVLPRDICPLIKSALGFKLLGLSYFELCDPIIIPTTCDGKKKLGSILNDFVPVWMLEIPERKNLKAAKDFWLGEIKLLKRRIEQITGIKIATQRLKQAIQLLHKRQEVFRRFYELRKRNPPLINGRDSLLVVQSSFYDNIDKWIQKTEELCEEVKNRTLFTLDRLPRLLITGAPIIWPNFKILNIIEEAGAIVVADELCSGTQWLYNPVEVDEWTEEGCLRAIANKYLLASTCPCFTESNDRIDRLLDLIKEFKVDGVIYHSLRLCQLYDIEFNRVRQVLKEKAIPLLNIYTDYSQEDVEQIKTRVEAFLEMLKSRK